jgi:hypothetical protein
MNERMPSTELAAQTPRADYQRYLEPALRRRRTALYTALGISALPLLIVLYALASDFDPRTTLTVLGIMAVLVLGITAAVVAFVGQDVTIGRKLLRDGSAVKGEVVATGQYASGQGTVDVRFALADGSERVTRFRLAVSGDEAARLAGKSVQVLTLGTQGPVGVVLGELGIVTTR